MAEAPWGDASDQLLSPLESESEEETDDIFKTAPVLDEKISFPPGFFSALLGEPEDKEERKMYDERVKRHNECVS